MVEKKKNWLSWIIGLLVLAVVGTGGFFLFKNLFLDKELPISVKESQDNAAEVPVYSADQETVFYFTGASGSSSDVMYRIVSQKDEDFKDVSYFTLSNPYNTEIVAEKGTPAGTYSLSIQVTAKGQGRYKDTEKTINYLLTIDKADNKYIEEPTVITDLEYTGEEQKLIKEGKPAYGKILYKLDDGEYSEKVPVAKDAGIYTVTFKTEGDQNHKDIKEKSLLVTVGRTTAGLKPAMSAGFGGFGGIGSTFSLSSLLNYVKNNTTLPSFNPDIIDFDPLNPSSDAQKASDKPGQALIFQYDGKEHTNGYTAPEGIRKAGADRGTNAGTYIAVYRPEKNYCWSDGSRDAVIVTMQINKASLTKPTVKNNLVYNGIMQTAELNGFIMDKMLAVGTSGLAAGEYTAVISLRDKVNYQWADGTSSDLMLKWSIARKKVNVPKVTTVFTYKTLLGIALPQFVNASDFDDAYDSSIMRIVSGNSASQAGKYSVEVKLKNTNYEWNDAEGGILNRHIPWEIRKQSVGEKPQDKTVSYNGRIQTNGYDKPSHVSLIGDACGKNAGTYIAQYAPEENYCWADGTSDRITVTLSIEKVQAVITDEPTAVSGLVYNSKSQKLIRKGKASGGTMVYSVDSGDFTTEIPTVVQAGEHKVTYYAKGDGNYIDSDQKTITVSIAKADPIITRKPAALNYDYDGNEHVLAEEGRSEHGTFLYSLDNMTYSETVPSASDAGTYDVYWKLRGDENHKSTDPKYVTAQIKSSKSAAYKEKPEALTSVYDGNEKALLSSGSSDQGTVLYKLGADGSFSEDIPTAINAGTYDLYYMIKADPNYEDSEVSHVKATIRNADLIVDAPNLYYVYDGTEKGAPISVTAVDGSTIKVTYKTSWLDHYSETVPTFTDVTKNILGIVTPVTVSYRAEAENHNTETGSYTVTVAQAAPVITPELEDHTLIYNGLSQKLSDSTVSGGKMLYSRTGLPFTWQEEAPSELAPDTYAFYYRVDGENSNYSDIGPLKVTVTIEPADLIIEKDLSGRPVSVTTVDGAQFVVIRYGLEKGQYIYSEEPQVASGTPVYYEITAPYHNTYEGEFVEGSDTYNMQSNDSVPAPDSAEDTEPAEESADIQPQGRMMMFHPTNIIDVRNDISLAYVYASDEEFMTIDNEVLPKVSVYYGDAELQEGIDYTIGYEIYDDYTGRMSLNGIGAYTGTYAFDYYRAVSETETETEEEKTAEKISLDDTYIVISDSEFAEMNDELVPAVYIYYDVLTLEEGIDYEITYSNVSESEGKITIKGIGDFTGTYENTYVRQSVTDEISDAAEKIDINQTYIYISDTEFVQRGSETVPAVYISYDVLTLEENIDYTVSVEPVDEITGRMIITGMGDFTGTFSTEFYRISQDAPEAEDNVSEEITGPETTATYEPSSIIDVRNDIDDAEIKPLKEGEEALYRMLEEEVIPAFNVVFEEHILIEKEDYELKTEAIDDKLGRIIITGKGAYSGEKEIIYNRIHIEDYLAMYGEIPHGISESEVSVQNDSAGEDENLSDLIPYEYQPPEPEPQEGTIPPENNVSDPDEEDDKQKSDDSSSDGTPDNVFYNKEDTVPDVETDSSEN